MPRLLAGLINAASAAGIHAGGLAALVLASDALCPSLVYPPVVPVGRKDQGLIVGLSFIRRWAPIVLYVVVPLDNFTWSGLVQVFYSSRRQGRLFGIEDCHL